MSSDSLSKYNESLELITPKTTGKNGSKGADRIGSQSSSVVVAGGLPPTAPGQTKLNNNAHNNPLAKGKQQQQQSLGAHNTRYQGKP